MQQIFSSMHLPCLYVKDYTCQEYRVFFQKDSSVDLTFRILLEYQFSDLAVFVGSHRNTCLHLYTACSSSIWNMISLYNRNSNDEALTNSGEAATYLCETNVHILCTYLMYLLFYKSTRDIFHIRRQCLASDREEAPGDEATCRCDKIKVICFSSRI